MRRDDFTQQQAADRLEELEAASLMKLRTLDMNENRTYIHANAATTAGGFGDPVYLADDRRTSAVFLRPLHGTPLWAGRVGDPRGSAGSKYRFANLHGSALPFGDGKAEMQTAYLEICHGSSPHRAA